MDAVDGHKAIRGPCRSPISDAIPRQPLSFHSCSWLVCAEPVGDQHSLHESWKRCCSYRSIGMTSGWSGRGLSNAYSRAWVLLAHSIVVWSRIGSALQCACWEQAALCFIIWRITLKISAFRQLKATCTSTLNILRRGGTVFSRAYAQISFHVVYDNLFLYQDSSFS